MTATTTPTAVGRLLLSGAQLTLVATLGLAVVLALIVPQFATLGNLLEVLRQSAVLGTLAIGVTFVVIAGRLDLSVGALLSVCAVIAVECENHYGTGVAIGAALTAGAIGGGINALLVARLRLNSLVTTLAMMSVLQGGLVAATGGRNALVGDPGASTLALLGRGTLFGLPLSVILLALLMTAGQLALTRTRWGCSVQAIGANEMASAYSGLPTRRILAGAYIVSGLFAGIAALLFASRVMAAQTDSGADMEIYAMAGIILGGTSLLGGTGSITRSIAGVVLLALIQNALLLLGLPYYAQWLCIWIALIAAVWADAAVRRGRLWA